MVTATDRKPTGPIETLRREASKKVSKEGDSNPRKKARKKKKAVEEELKADATKGLLFDPEVKLPAKGKRLASVFKETSEAKSSTTAAAKTAKLNLIEWMKETGTPRVPVELGGVRKIIHIEEEDKLVIETAAEPPKAGDKSEDDNGKA